MQENSPLLLTGNIRNNRTKLTISLISIIFALGVALLLNLASKAHQLVLVQNHIVQNGLTQDFVYREPKVFVVAIYTNLLSLTMLALVSAGNLFLCEGIFSYFS
jgi:hypothetical protein